MTLIWGDGGTSFDDSQKNIKSNNKSDAETPRFCTNIKTIENFSKMRLIGELTLGDTIVWLITHSSWRELPSLT